MNTITIIIEQHEDGFVGYPLGFKAGAIVGQATPITMLWRTRALLLHSTSNIMEWRAFQVDLSMKARL